MTDRPPVVVGSGTVYVAPVGADPADRSQWTELGLGDSSFQITGDDVGKVLSFSKSHAVTIQIPAPSTAEERAEREALYYLLLSGWLPIAPQTRDGKGDQ